MKSKRYLFVVLVLFTFCGTELASQNAEQSKWSLSGTQVRPGSDPFMQKLYWEINNSAMQEKLRDLRPFPVGVVYYQQREDDFDAAVKEFKTIKKLGFTALKQLKLDSPKNPQGFKEKVFNAAIDEGISPWYYGKGGWEHIDQQLLNKLGIEMTYSFENLPKIQSDARMVAYQNDVWRKRVDIMADKPEPPKGMGEPGRNNPWLPKRLTAPFSEWLKQEYGVLDTLKSAWNSGFTDTQDFKSFDGAAQSLIGSGFDNYGNGKGSKVSDFRRYRDAMKFQSSLIVDNYQQTMDLYHKWDPEEPERTGGHQVFENQAVNAWDLEGQAKTASIGGSFYASVHLPHHFFLIDNEVTRPVYWQSRIIADMFKGGWTATWESTGGPTQWSGHEGYTVDGNTMSQLFVSYLASGLKGVGIWMWNSRGEGWEVGEYALTDIQGEPSDRAIVAGKFSKKLQEHRYELWDSQDEPIVGIFYSWENEALLGRLSLGAYDMNTPVYKTDRDLKFRQFHTEGRLGISRALTNNNVPFEYVTERNLEEGLAARYPVIYLPYILALDDKHVKLLIEYVAQGGRLVADFPLLMLDNYGRLNKQKVGSDFEELFGLQVGDYYNSFNRSIVFEGDTLHNTQYGKLKLTQAEVLNTFGNGVPAVTRNSYKKGEAILLNFEASREAYKPGNTKMEDILTYYSLGDIRPPFEVAGSKNTFVMRRAAPKADHYFIVNDGETETVNIHSDVIRYENIRNVYTDEVISVAKKGFDITVPARSGVWIRAEKRDKKNHFISPIYLKTE